MIVLMKIEKVKVNSTPNGKPGPQEVSYEVKPLGEVGYFSAKELRAIAETRRA